MAVPCPRCGRNYDITLFQYGRTIHCACGERVGLRMERVLLNGPDPPRFIADVMLGRLARWLRVIGCDVTYEAGISDADLVHRAVDERRVVLTRDRALPEEWWIGNCVVPASEEPLEQLREVVERFAIPWDRRLFTRCTLCNEPLQRLDETEAPRFVPEGIRERHSSFSRCPSCGRLYWSGTHTDRMRGRLSTVLGASESDGGGQA